MLLDLVDNNQMIFRILDIPQNDQQTLDKRLEKFNQWNFDSIEFHQLYQQQGFMVICLKVISSNVGIKSFGIPLHPLLDLLKTLYSYMQNDSKCYQSISNLIDNLQALNYFLRIGNMRKYFTEADIFGLIVACLIMNYNHT